MTVGAGCAALGLDRAQIAGFQSPTGVIFLWRMLKSGLREIPKVPAKQARLGMMA